MEGLIDVQDTNESIKIGNGKSGTLNCEVNQLDRHKLLVTLRNVKYVPDLSSNLFSLNKVLKKRI
jgi:hypothetical protein